MNAAPDVHELLERAAAGDASAAEALLTRYRSRLRRMVACRMDHQLATRVDPSDVVQEALLNANERLDVYLQTRPIAFYPWLRQITCDRLADVHRRHLRAQCRSVQREVSLHLRLPDASASRLARQLIASGTNPFQRLADSELREQVRLALSRLSPRDQEVIALRFVELLSVQEAAEVLSITDGAFKVRQFRALQRLRDLLAIDSDDS